MERLQQVLLMILVFICICGVSVAFYILIRYALAINTNTNEVKETRIELNCDLNEIDSSIDLSCIKK